MRRHWFALLVACVAVGGASGRALSDGPYDYAPTYAPAPMGWTGFYIGAHLGGTWGSSEANGRNGVTLDDSWSASPSGLVAGGTLGYNWQTGPVVYGIEGDLGNLGLAGSGGYYVPFGYDASTTTDAGFYMTLRARLGVLMNGWMLYATGGYLGADTTVSVLEACDILCSTPVVSASTTSFRNGWTIGGGFEAALEGAWTAKVEYLYYDIGSVTLTTPAGVSIGANTWNVATDGSLVRVGINYRFNGFKFGQ
ncbi:MAG: outer membrane beta-barrel protein [Hyphomicrobium sp.]